MARSSGATSKVYVDEFECSGLANSIESSVDNNLPEVTSFDDAAATYVEGKYAAKATVNGFFDGASGGYDAKMMTVLSDGLQHKVGLYAGNDASHGDIGLEILSDPASQVRSAKVAESLMLNMEWVASGAIVRSQVLCNGAVTGTGVVTNSTKNIGVTTTPAGFLIVLRVLAVGGAGSITVRVEEADTEGGVYSTLETFTLATAVGCERKRITASTKAWKRVNITTYATFTSVTVMVSVGAEI